MAMTKCPECGKDVSDRATVCPHCGYPLTADMTVTGGSSSVTLASLKDRLPLEETATEVASSSLIEAYDVMLVDYGNSRGNTIADLMEHLSITRKEAVQIVDTLPCYLYNDIEKEDAEAIARILQNCNMRIAVYNPVGNVRYYEPARYVNRPLPVVVPIPRRRRMVEPPVGILRRRPEPKPSPIRNSRMERGPRPETGRRNENGSTGNRRGDGRGENMNRGGRGGMGPGPR